MRYNGRVVKNWSNHERIEDHWISFVLHRTIISQLHSFIFRRYPLRLLRKESFPKKNALQAIIFHFSRVVLISFAPLFFYLSSTSNTIVFVYIFRMLFIIIFPNKRVKNKILLNSSNLSIDFQITSRSKWENGTFELILSTSNTITFVYIFPTFIILASKQTSIR